MGVPANVWDEWGFGPSVRRWEAYCRELDEAELSLAAIHAATGKQQMESHLSDTLALLKIIVVRDEREL
jgi:hypothetical protein